MRSTHVQPMVVVEDSDEDFETLTWALRRLTIQNPVVRCLDGEEALDLLTGRDDYAAIIGGQRPAMVLLDLNLTIGDGRDVLSTLKQDDHLKAIPVVIWTSSSNPQDVDLCYRRGANSYIVKPTHLDKLLSAVALLQRYWLEVVTLPN